MDKLQRQRALVQEHLRWLESEIAEEASRLQPVPPGTAERAGAPESPAIADASANPAGAAPLPDLDVPEPNVRGIHSEVRSGCLLYFGIAFAVVGLAVAYIYWRY